jgi:hypothetical protein
MRSEKEVKEKIEATKSLMANAKAQGMRSLANVYAETVEALEWVLTEPNPEPLTPIELKELRALLAEHRKQRRASLGQAPMGAS